MTATKAGKKTVEKTSQPKKAAKSTEFIVTNRDGSSEEEEEEPPHDKKGKKDLLFRGSKVFLIFNREKRWKE